MYYILASGSNYSHGKFQALKKGVIKEQVHQPLDRCSCSFQLCNVNCPLVVTWHHRRPKLTLRAAHKLDCFFHAMHNNDIGTLCIIMTSATFKSLYRNDTKRLKLPQIRKKSK